MKSFKSDDETTLNIFEKINGRIVRLQDFKVKAAKSCGKETHSINWFEVDHNLFVEYNIDRINIVSDPYYIGECIDNAIHELSMIRDACVLV